MIEEILQWLRQVPGLSELEPEYLAARDGASGLFCRGRQVVWERSDINGAKSRRLRLELILAVHSAETHVPQLALALDDRLQTDAPRLGLDQTVRLEQGHTAKHDGLGLLRTEARLTFEYTVKEEN